MILCLNTGYNLSDIIQNNWIVNNTKIHDKIVVEVVSPMGGESDVQIVTYASRFNSDLHFSVMVIL